MTEATCAAHYLAGLFDGEGHIEWQGRYVISNTEASIIEAACEALDLLGIDYRMRVRDRHLGHKPVTEIIINRLASRQRFVERVPIRSVPKQGKLAEDMGANQLQLAP